MKLNTTCLPAYGVRMYLTAVGNVLAQGYNGARVTFRSGNIQATCVDNIRSTAQSKSTITMNDHAFGFVRIASINGLRKYIPACTGR